MNERVKLTKEEKVKRILFGCVEQFIKTGKPVGSNSLKGAGFDELSSATIRNYYTDLEEDGYLEQLHTSGGRIPTDKAYRYYIEAVERDLLKGHLFATVEMQKVLNRDTIDLGSYLLEAANWLSSELKTPVFLSSPRFDHDLVKSIKPIVIDTKRCLFVIITQFGQVLTELLPIDDMLTRQAEKRMENYFSWRLRQSEDDEKPEDFEEMAMAEHFYRELMLRYMVRYSHFGTDEIIRSGFSNLLFAEDLKDSSTLATTLGLFESPKAIRHVLREAVKKPQLSTWVGSDLNKYYQGMNKAALVALPYKIGPKTVGAVALLGQTRSHYQQWIETLYPFVDLLTKNLTFNIYQHGISFREAKDEHPLIQHRPPILIENKIKET